MAVPHRIAYALVAALACSGTALPARAYSAAEAYMEPAASGGGGGRWFSGSPADGFSCGVCHLPSGVRAFPLHVSGLPRDAGYALAAKQQVVMSWPEFAARWRELRPDPTQPRVPGAPAPSEGLVAELVAESGGASGMIEIDSRSLDPLELCELTRPNLKPRVAAKLYRVRPGVDAQLVKPDAAGVLRCDSQQLGQRCIIALSSCGAQQIRFTWTAPPAVQGPIWFAAGFVASEALSGTPELDSVDVMSLPIVPVGSAAGEYEQVLRDGCGLPGGGTHPAGGLLLTAVAVLAARLRRRPWRAAGEQR
jgi:hypothetical protein